MYLGVDIGGTFTDLVLMDDTGSIDTAKAPTTPSQLEKGVFDAISLAAEKRGWQPDELLARVTAFGHGTTQATNALIERDGAVTGLITTRGFRDTLSVQRLMGFTAGLSVDQLSWYSRRRYPDPIVPRSLTLEVPERVDQAGNVLLPLDEDAVRRAVRKLKALAVEAFAVALLWSFRNPRHEQRVGEIIGEMCPDAYISLSSEVAPVIGEYERTATTVLNSYLASKVVSYLERVEDLLRAQRFEGNFYVLNSGGGVMAAQEAARKPVLLIASGPTGGVLGSLQIGQEIGQPNIITTDMGGTSFDVAIVIDGKPLVSATHEAGGYHLATPMIDIRAVGAGGGSIAKVENGLLSVGPESAGARPGPVCYGQGGTRATVTDADIVLGIISPDNFLGGRMKLDRDAAVDAIREQIAAPLGMKVERAAAGIRQVVDGHMADTLREMTIGRGHDPRDFVLFAYGGAGPAHCTSYGAELGVSKIIIPATSMAHSAFGALAADIHRTAERSFLLRGGGGERDPWDGIDFKVVAGLFKELEKQCLEALRLSGVRKSEAEFQRSIDMRYRRQTHELIVPVPGGRITAKTIRSIAADFEKTYEAVYGRGAGFRAAGIELVTFRIAGIGRTAKPKIAGPKAGHGPKAKSRRIFEPAGQRFVSANIWDWLALPAGYRVAGPSIIEHPETTVYIGPGQTANIDADGKLSIELGKTRK
jgi:N-methylhydantoinase A